MKKQMKKLFLPGLAVGLVLGLTGCGVKKSNTEVTETPALEATVNAADEDNAAIAEKAEGFPYTLTTNNDMEVTFDHVPQRVLSTNVNTGEQLMALGLGDKIIATSYNNEEMVDEYREEYDSKPVIADKYPALETVLDLNPDFIYGRSSAFSDKDTSITTHDKLSQYGVMSLSSIESYKLGADVEDAYQDFYHLGRIFQVEDKANEIVEGMKAQIEGVKEVVKDLEPVKVFNFDAEREGGAYTPGNNFTSKLFRHAGGVNIFEDLEKTWNTVSWEAVLEANPDVIVINDYGSVSVEEKIALLNSTPALSGVKAIQDQNFIVITLPEVFANSRIGNTVEKFARGFHPSAFE